MDGPYIRVEDGGLMLPLREDVTTIGRGTSVDVHLSDPSVSRLHAEIIRRGPYAYVTDLGLSRNGTRVNGRLVARPGVRARGGGVARRGGAEASGRARADPPGA